MRKIKFYCALRTRRRQQSHLATAASVFKRLNGISLRKHPFLLRSSPLGTFREEGETDAFAGYSKYKNLSIIVIYVY